MKTRKSALIGRRTKADILKDKDVRKDEEGKDRFEDYWTDSDGESSVLSNANFTEKSYCSKIIAQDPEISTRSLRRSQRNIGQSFSEELFSVSKTSSSTTSDSPKMNLRPLSSISHYQTKNNSLKDNVESSFCEQITHVSSQITRTEDSPHRTSVVLRSASQNKSQNNSPLNDKKSINKPILSIDKKPINDKSTAGLSANSVNVKASNHSSLTQHLSSSSSKPVNDSRAPTTLQFKSKSFVSKKSLIPKVSDSQVRIVDQISDKSLGIYEIISSPKRSGDSPLIEKTQSKSSGKVKEILSDYEELEAVMMYMMESSKKQEKEAQPNNLTYERTDCPTNNKKARQNSQKNAIDSLENQPITVENYNFSTSNLPNPVDREECQELNGSKSKTLPVLPSNKDCDIVGVSSNPMLGGVSHEDLSTNHSIHANESTDDYSSQKHASSFIKDQTVKNISNGESIRRVKAISYKKKNVSQTENHDMQVVSSMKNVSNISKNIKSVKAMSFPTEEINCQTENNDAELPEDRYMEDVAVNVRDNKQKTPENHELNRSEGKTSRTSALNPGDLTYEDRNPMLEVVSPQRDSSANHSIHANESNDSYSRRHASSAQKDQTITDVSSVSESVKRVEAVSLQTEGINCDTENHDIELPKQLEDVAVKKTGKKRKTAKSYVLNRSEGKTSRTSALNPGDLTYEARNPMLEVVSPQRESSANHSIHANESNDSYSRRHASSAQKDQTIRDVSNVSETIKRVEAVSLQTEGNNCQTKNHDIELPKQRDKRDVAVKTTKKQKTSKNSKKNRMVEDFKPSRKSQSLKKSKGTSLISASNEDYHTINLSRNPRLEGISPEKDLSTNCSIYANESNDDFSSEEHASSSRKDRPMKDVSNLSENNRRVKAMSLLNEGIDCQTVNLDNEHLDNEKVPAKGRGKKRKSPKSSKRNEVMEDFEFSPEKKIRRSSRNRYAPLAHWRNERLLYRFERGDIKVLGIGQGTSEDNQSVKSMLKGVEPNKKQKRKSGNGALYDKVNDKKVSLKLARFYSSIKWDTSPNKPYRIKKLFSTSTVSFGYLEIKGFEMKHTQYMPEEDLQMIVMKGRIEVLIQENKIEAVERDMFIVPRGTAYCIKNLEKKTALLSFSVGKFKFLESGLD